MEIIRFLTASIFVILYSFFVFRIIIRREYKKNKSLKWFITLLQVLVFFFHGCLSYLFLPASWFSLPSLSENGILNLFGIVLLGISLFFILVSMGSLGYAKTIGVKLDNLKETGFYRFSRNPQLIFYTFFLIGFALLYPSWYFIPWIVIYFILAHMMVVTEEENLQRTFGKSFEDYCRRVPRYLRFPGFK